MSKVTLNYLFLSLFMLLISTLNGWILTDKLASPEAGIRFFYFGIPITLVIFIYQALIFHSAQEKLLFQLMYHGSYGFNMGWFFFSFFIPLFWLDTITTLSKIMFLTIFTIICIANISIALRIINRKWKDIGAAEFEKRFRPANSTVDWDKVIKKMKIEPDLCLPGVPPSWAPAITILMIVFVFVGLALQTSYPVFSFFALGIPLAITVSFFLQMSAYVFSQACKVKTLEKSRGMTLKSVV